jgi:hypothetical protein
MTAQSARAFFLLFAAAWSTWAQAIPRFEDYPVTEVFKGSPAVPILATPEDRMYRTRIREGVSKGWGVIRDGKEQPGPNFAGHYFAIEWGCGVPCVMMVVVDALTGKIYHLPLAVGTKGSQKIGVPFFGLRSAEVNFRPTSRLLTMDTCPEQSEKPDAACYSHYFLWENNAWKLLRRVRIESPLFDAQ